MCIVQDWWINLLHKTHFVSVEDECGCGWDPLWGCCRLALVHVNFKEDGVGISSCHLLKHWGDALAWTTPAHRHYYIIKKVVFLTPNSNYMQQQKKSTFLSTSPLGLYIHNPFSNKPSGKHLKLHHLFTILYTVYLPIIIYPLLWTILRHFS